MKIFSGRAARPLTSAICAHLGVPEGKAEIFKFSNDNTFVRIEENVRNTEVYVVQTSCPPVDEALVELLIMIDALKRASARHVTAVLPYYPYVRSDKKDQPRVPITARLVADMLVTAGVDRVVTLDLTADQIQGFFSVPADHLTAQPVLTRYFQEARLSPHDAVIVAPDPGAVKRAQKFAQRLGLTVAFVDKRRVGAEVVATSVVGEVEGRTAILFDEEIDRGSSMIQAADLLLKLGAREVHAAATHPVFSGPAVERLAQSRIKQVITTDSVPVPPEKRWPGLTVLSVAPLLAEALRRIECGESLAALFE